MAKPIKIIGPRDPRDKRAINTTSSCKGMGRNFSPFLLGPVDLYPNAVTTQSMNVENAWQFSKVYKCHVDQNGDPTEQYFKWAKKGFEDTKAHRYPMGKCAKPEYSLWAGEKLDHISARKKIYFPLYARAVMKTDAYKSLKQGYDDGNEIILWCFDGYDYHSLGMTLRDVLNDTSRSMGHAFVIAALIEGAFDGEKT